MLGSNLLLYFFSVFLVISVLYILVVIALTTYNVYRLIVQKALNECIGLTLLLACFLMLNHDLLLSERGFKCFSSLSFSEVSITDYFCLFTTFTICFFSTVYFLVLANFLKKYRWTSFKSSVFSKVVESCVLEIFIFLLQYSSTIYFLIRLVWTAVVIILCSPEYVYCMDLDPSNAVAQYTIFHWPGLSEAQLKLGDAKANLESFLKSVNDGDTDLPGSHKTLQDTSVQIEDVKKKVKKTKNLFYASVGDVSDQLDFIKVVLDKHGSQIRDHDNILNGDSELRRVVNEIEWKSTTALGILGAALAAMAVVLIKVSRN